jgi:endonuclease YncB( thermonuclease family)
LLAIGAGGIAVMAGKSTRSTARVATGARIISADTGQVAVIDGDTLRLGEQVVRLSDVSAPARGQACAAGSDCGARASDALADLVRNQAVACRVSGHDSLGRPAAQCDAGGRDVNVALVATGWARSEVDAYGAAELDARAHRRGIWAAN